jgi:hypothetical protein
MPCFAFDTSSNEKLRKTRSLTSIVDDDENTVERVAMEKGRERIERGVEER